MFKLTLLGAIFPSRLLHSRHFYRYCIHYKACYIIIGKGLINPLLLFLLPFYRQENTFLKSKSPGVFWLHLCLFFLWLDYPAINNEVNLCRRQISQHNSDLGDLLTPCRSYVVLLPVGILPGFQGEVCPAPHYSVVCRGRSWSRPRGTPHTSFIRRSGIQTLLHCCCCCPVRSTLCGCMRYDTISDPYWFYSLFFSIK